MSEIIHRTKLEAEELARKEGLVCFIAKSDELLLDFDLVGVDDSDIVEHMLKIVGLLQQNRIEVYGGTYILCTISKSAEGQHYYIKLKEPMDPMMKVALQACMGSDPVRECLSAIRIMRKVEALSCLFETKHEAKNVRAWRDGSSKCSPNAGQRTEKL